MTEKTIFTREECAEEVRLMARRTALLYYAFAEQVIAALGEEEGKRLIRQAIQSYGEFCGKAIRRQILEMGLPPEPENMSLARDLPQVGWENAQIPQPDGTVRSVCTYCPLAATWQELGSKAVELGSLYCGVDQAKQAGYNPGYEFIHAQNVLRGDPCCEFVVRKREE